MGMMFLAAMCIPGAYGANIITFGVNANACGSSVMCSTNGTTGYLNNGTGVAFNLSTISQWFQIDADGVNRLASQTMAEPDGGAGGFRVKNDTGATVTTFSLTLTDTFNASTPSHHFCSGGSGPICINFQANKGTQSGTSESLSGTGLFSCTNGGLSGGICSSTAGQAAADFQTNQVIYTWNGLNIGANAYFDITFASWDNSSSPTSVPEPASIVLLCSVLLITFVTLRKALPS